MRKIWGILLAGGMIGLMVNGAEASSTSTTVTVTASGVGSCSATAASIAFGNYSGALIQTNSNLIINCTSGTPYSIALSTGNSSSYTLRTMTNGSNSLGYNIYTTSGYTTVWGDGTGSTGTVSNTGTGAAQNNTMYAEIPASETFSNGVSYSDTVTATITY